MAGESLVQVTEGSGKKLHTWSRVVGANTVEDEVVLNGLPSLPTYIATTGSVSNATANSHLLQVMAGAALNVYITRIVVYQAVAATAAAIARYQILRLTTAGTGGGVVSGSPLDGSDGASGATAMSLPTVKGTEGTILLRLARLLFQTPQLGGGDAKVIDWDADRLKVKPIRIAAGIANGIALKNVDAQAGATLDINIEFIEASY